MFGSICYVQVPESQRTELDAKEGNVLRAGNELVLSKFVVSRDVVFD